MLKKFSILIFLLIPLTATAKLKVVTTIPDLAALTREVGGDKVDVKSLAPAGQDPHTLEPKPSYVVAVNQADLLIEVGLSLEVGWLPVLTTQARNPKIQKGQPGHLEASVGIRILEIPTAAIDRSMGDIHPEGNPHYWLDPRNGLIIASNIAARLAELDPENAKFYQDHYSTFRQEFSEKIKGWEKSLAKVRGKKIVTQHRSFSYFVDWAGLQSVGQIEPKPGIPPTPSHLLSLIDILKKGSVAFMLVEDYYDTKPSQELSKKTGVPVLVVPTSSGSRYEELFENLVQKIVGLP